MNIEESPEFKKALNEACEKQYRGYLYGGEYAKAHSKDKIPDVMEEIQRQRVSIEREYPDAKELADRVRGQMMLFSNPHMRTITENFEIKYSSKSNLVCPVCGEGDRGNRVNGKAYCFMNAKHKERGVDGPVPLMTPEKAKNWKPPKKMKTLQELIDESLNAPKGVTRKR